MRIRARRPAVELARVGGALEVRLHGLVTAYEERLARWRAVVQWGLVSLALLVSVILGTLALRWDYARQAEIRLLTWDKRQLLRERTCWRAVALDLRPIREWPESKLREAWVRACVAREGP